MAGVDDDEFGGAGALCRVWTAHALRRNGMRTRARSPLPDRRFEICTTITVLLSGNRVGCFIEFNDLHIIGKVFAIS